MTIKLRIGQHPPLKGADRMRRQPGLVGGLATAGILLFSGSCYAAAFTEDKANGKLAPYGCASVQQFSSRCASSGGTPGADQEALTLQGHELHRGMAGAGFVTPRRSCRFMDSVVLHFPWRASGSGFRVEYVCCAHELQCGSGVPHCSVWVRELGTFVHLCIRRNEGPEH